MSASSLPTKRSGLVPLHEYEQRTEPFCRPACLERRHDPGSGLVVPREGQRNGMVLSWRIQLVWALARIDPDASGPDIAGPFPHIYRRFNQ